MVLFSVLVIVSENNRFSLLLDEVVIRSLLEYEENSKNQSPSPGTGAARLSSQKPGLSRKKYGILVQAFSFVLAALHLRLFF